MISTHWNRVHQPSARELDLLDVLARQAADLIERTQAEQAVRESEERFRAVANFVPDLLWSSDAAGNTSWYNRRLAEYTGHPLEASIGRGWLQAVHPADRAKSRRVFQTAIAEGRAIVRRGLRALLEGEDGCRVVGEAADGLTAIEAIARLRPDVVVLDVQMPDLNGLEVARRVCERSPGTRVVVLSMHADEPYVLDALRHGAMGYVLKGAADTDLLAAVRAAMAGERYLSAPLTQRALDAYARRAEGAGRPLDRYELLTPREREVLQLAAQGLGNAEVGGRLGISPRTAETHRTNLLRKLGLQSQTDLVRFAVGRGLVPGIG